jgi:hypothetical protein
VEVAEVLATGVVGSTEGSDVAGAMGKSAVVDEPARVGTSADPSPLVVLVHAASNPAAISATAPFLITADSMPCRRRGCTRSGARHP